MKVLSLVLALYLLLTPTPVILGIQPISTEGGQGFCTSFSVNQQKRMYVTAAHCVDDQNPDLPEGYIFSQRFTIKKFDRDLDIAVVQGAIGAPEMQVSLTQPEKDDYAWVYGFSHGEELPTEYYGVYKNLVMLFDRETHKFQVASGFELQIEKGQSGSPIMDSEGNVISVAQSTFPDLGMGCGPPYVTFYDFVREYLPKR